jgi:quercetin dioxygenase-like cupin family protein
MLLLLPPLPCAIRRAPAARGAPARRTAPPRAATDTAGYVAHALAGAAARELPGRTAVPLLSPGRDGLPFAAALVIDRAGGAAAPPPPASAEVFELRFVLSGAGELAHPDGRRDALAPGDTVLCTAGAARARGGEISGAAGEDLASLVIYMPRALLDAALCGDAAAEGAAGAEESAGEVARVAREAWGGGAAAGAVPAAELAALLGGASALARRAAATPPAALPPPPAPPAALLAAAAAPVRWLATAAAAAFSAGWAARGGGGGAAAARVGDAPVLRRLRDLAAYTPPGQTNRLALVFDPLGEADHPPVPFVFGVEVFEPGHRTAPHAHPAAHELFFVLAGAGEGFAGGARFPLRAGDAAVFRPGAEHGIDVGAGGGRLYCLELMLPNEAFAEFVRAGTRARGLGLDDLCVLARVGCR